MFHAIFLLCAQFFFVQNITTQYVGACNGLEGFGRGIDNLAWGTATWGLLDPCMGLLEGPWFSPSASYGGGFAVTSTSPIVPTGIIVTSENLYDGPLVVSGQLPFLGTVALEGTVPSLGAGAINYGCGNGNVEILREDIGPAGYGEPFGYGPMGYGSHVGYGGPLGYGGPIGYGALGYGAPGYGLGFGTCGGITRI